MRTIRDVEDVILGTSFLLNPKSYEARQFRRTIRRLIAQVVIDLNVNSRTKCINPLTPLSEAAVKLLHDAEIEKGRISTLRRERQNYIREE